MKSENYGLSADRDDDFGVFLANRRKHTRIFMTDKFHFRERDKYEFVAEFADKGLACDFARYLQDITNHEKDIIFMECDVEKPGTDGYVPVVLNIMGEYMLAEEIEGMNIPTDNGGYETSVLAEGDDSETEEYLESCGGIESVPMPEPEVKSMFKPYKPKKPLTKMPKKRICVD